MYIDGVYITSGYCGIGVEPTLNLAVFADLLMPPHPTPSRKASVVRHMKRNKVKNNKVCTTIKLNILLLFFLSRQS